MRGWNPAIEVDSELKLSHWTLFSCHLLPEQWSPTATLTRLNLITNTNLIPKQLAPSTSCSWVRATSWLPTQPTTITPHSTTCSPKGSQRLAHLWMLHKVMGYERFVAKIDSSLGNDSPLEHRSQVWAGTSSHLLPEQSHSNPYYITLLYVNLDLYNFIIWQS